MTINISRRSLATLLIAGAILWQSLHTGAVGQTVINVPPDPAPTEISGDVILNLFEGGAFSQSFDVESGATLNLNGGDAGFGIHAEDGSTVNINAGHVGSFTALSGSIVNITGGSFPNSIRSFPGSTMDLRGGNFGGRFHAWGELTFHGDSFHIDGAPLSNLEDIGDTTTLLLPLRSEFTGVLADGTPFAFSYLDYDDQLQNATLTLVRAEAPAIDMQEIILPMEPAPRGVRAGQTLVVRDGGLVGDDFHAAAGSTVEVDGGSIGDNFEAAATSVDIRRGSIGAEFGVFSGSVVNVVGGEVGDGVRILPGSTFNVQGGRVGGIYSSAGSVIEVEGGTLTGQIWTRRDTQFVVHGAEFQLNGEPIAGLDEIGSRQTFDPPQNYVLSGTLSDGQPFAFSSDDYDTFEPGTLSLVRSDTPAIQPGIISVPAFPAPSGIRAGQTVIVAEGGVLDGSFNAGNGSTVSVEGGHVGDNLEAVGAVVRLSDGSIGPNFDAFAATHVTISAGEVGHNFYAGSGSEVHVEGGSIGGGFYADDGSRIFVTGGSITDFVVESGAHLMISGGDIAPGYDVGRGFHAESGSTVELIGTSFLLDGAQIPELNQPGESILIDNRNGELLQVAFLDGAVDDFILREHERATPGNFANGSILRLTVGVPEPSGFGMLLSALLLSFGFRVIGRRSFAFVQNRFR